MALAKNLPIYKVAYDLLSVATDYVKNMPRSVKTVIGGRLADLCMQIVLLIVRANIAREKAPFLADLRERIEELEILIRICQDKHFINRGQYAAAAELIESVGRQATGWSRKHAVPSPVA